MKRAYLGSLILSVLLLLLSTTYSYAVGLEISAGYWKQDPSGDISYKGESLDVEDNLKYDSEKKPFFRAKLQTPLFLPNIYLMATPMKFEETGSKDINFRFGDTTFTANVPFDSMVKLNHYDIGLYYSLPFINTATAGVLNMELGINARIIDLKAEVSQGNLSESKSFTLPVPMLYAAVQLNPAGFLSIEAEGRGIAYSSNHYYDLIGRVKIKPIGPLFIGGGYRYEKIKIDHSDVEASIKFKGPFVEVGMSF